MDRSAERRAIWIAVFIFTAIVVLTELFGEEAIVDSIYSWCCS